MFSSAELYKVCTLSPFKIHSDTKRLFISTVQSDSVPLFKSVSSFDGVFSFLDGMTDLSSLNFCSSAALIKLCTRFICISSFLAHITEFVDCDISLLLSSTSFSSSFVTFKVP